MNKELISAKIALENLTKELEEKNRIFEELVNFDGLTGLYNHRYFHVVLEQEINRAIRNEEELSLILVDIDYFKKINDKYGHLVGDFVLKAFSNLLRTSLRDYETVARYGGEEFAIILVNTDLDGAITVAEKIRSQLLSSAFRDKIRSYEITASFGIACAKPASEKSFSKNDFIDKADQALYLAKKNGRNRVESYTKKKKWFSFS
jgi:diguanylate cyclase (GGDEF)-like protein